MTPSPPPRRSPREIARALERIEADAADPGDVSIVFADRDDESGDRVWRHGDGRRRVAESVARTADVFLSLECEYTHVIDVGSLEVIAAHPVVDGETIDAIVLTPALDLVGIDLAATEHDDPDAVVDEYAHLFEPASSGADTPASSDG